MTVISKHFYTDHLTVKLVSCSASDESLSYCVELDEVGNVVELDCASKADAIVLFSSIVLASAAL